MSSIIPPECQMFAAEAVASGKYRSEEELIFTALRLLEKRERRVDALRDDIQVGLRELDQGQGILIDSPEAERAFFDDIKARGRRVLHGVRDIGAPPS